MGEKTRFRKRLGADVIHQINEWMWEEEAERQVRIFVLSLEVDAADADHR